MELELWAAIADWPGYEVSTLGAVRRGDELAPMWRNKRRRWYAELKRADGTAVLRGVSRLVLQTFVGEPPARWQVNHMDGNRSNDALENLQWVSASQNIQHAWDTGLRRRGGRAVCRRGHARTPGHHCLRCRRVAARRARARKHGQPLLSSIEL